MRPGAVMRERGSETPGAASCFAQPFSHSSILRYPHNVSHPSPFFIAYTFLIFQSAFWRPFRAPSLPSFLRCFLFVKFASPHSFQLSFVIHNSQHFGWFMSTLSAILFPLPFDGCTCSSSSFKLGHPHSLYIAFFYTLYLSLNLCYCYFVRIVHRCSFLCPPDYFRSFRLYISSRSHTHILIIISSSFGLAKFNFILNLELQI